MTQNKLDGPQSSKLCKTFKLTKRERERGRDSKSVKDKERETDQTKPWWPRESTGDTHG